MKDLGNPEEKWNEEDNLRPFNANNNGRKNEDYPEYTRAVVFDEKMNCNVESEQRRVVNEDVQRGINRC